MRRTSGWLMGLGLGGLVFLYLPVVILIVFSFNDSRLLATWEGMTLAWYRLLLDDQALWDATWNSLLVAGCSTVGAVLLGTTTAVMLERAPFRRQGVVDGAVLLPLVIPEVMMGVSLLLFFVLIDLPLSLVTVMIGHITFNLPIAIVVVRARLRKLNPRLEEAARDLGATAWDAFRRITFPLLRPAILAAVLMTFTISLDDVVITFFTAGPGATTLPLQVFSMIKSGVSPEINALSALLVLISMTLVGLSLVFQRRDVR